MKKLTILFTLLVITLGTWAQTVYPVRTYTVLNPPMPYTLSGFASEPGRMQLNINVDDVSLERYPVYFRLVIKGNGIKMYTKPNMYQDPFYLDGGMHEVITGLDLEPLFNPKNLIFEGFSLREYERSGRLPEGVYQVSVELWDYYHKINISQAMPGVAVMYLTRAPRLTFPRDKDEIDILSNPNLRFSWMGSMPNDPTTDPVYRFNLYEIRPEGRNPYEVVRVSPPIFTLDTKQSSLIYDMGMPPLEEGINYAWQIQSVDLEGKAKFQNDGLSEVYSFRYGKACETPEIQITKVTTTDVQLKFSSDINIQLYRIFYKTTDEDDWQSIETDVPNYTLSGLQENTGYEIKVSALCGEEESDESSIVRCKTNLDVDYTCGKIPDNFDISNTEPLPALRKFDFFKAADFSIQASEVTGENGRFSGSGFALVPYLSFVKFAVEFENIFINADRRMTEGSVKFVYDEANGLVVALDKIVKGGADADEEVSTEEAMGDATDKQVSVDEEIKSVKIDGNKVTVTTDDGKTEVITVEEGQTVGISSKKNDTVYVADTGSGQIYTAPNPSRNGAKSSSVGTASQTGEYGVTAEFVPATNQLYGFDNVPKDSNKKPNNYFSINKSGDKIAWKSLASGRAEYLGVEIKGKENDTLRYIRSSGMLAPYSKSKAGDQLLLTGMSEGEEEILTAASVKKESINDSTTNEILTEVGAIGLVSYAPIHKEVVLVPLNNAQCPTGAGAIKTALDKLYAPAIVSWTVKIDKNFDYDGLNSSTFSSHDKESSSKYTDGMNELIDTYKTESGEVDPNCHYLFFVSDPSINIQGYMPLTGRFGFIFNFSSNINTLGQELGHGLFNLRHTYSEESQYSLPSGSTQNLLDNANGNELWKYQWDFIHNPEEVITGFMQDYELLVSNTDVLKSDKHDTNENDSEVNNVSVGTGVKVGDEVKFGPILITIKSEPTSVVTDNNCLYTVDKADFELVMSDVAIGNYTATIQGAKLKYSIDCNDGSLKNATISWNSVEGLEINNIGFIDATINEVELGIDNVGKLNGSIDLKAQLNSDKTIKDILVIKSGLEGDFKFTFNSDVAGFSGDFDFNGIENINIDLIKGEKIFASIKNGVLDSEGKLVSDISLEEPISYIENGFNITLKQLGGSIEYYTAENKYDFTNINGLATISQIPGVNSSLDIGFEMNEDLIQGRISNVSPISIYGMTIEAELIKASFNKQFELIQIEGNEILAAYKKDQAGKVLSGNINVSNFLIKDNQISTITGNGTVAYEPFAEIQLSGAEYDSQSKSIAFQASIDLAANESNTAKTTINKVTINEDGSYSIGEVSVDLVADFGPLKVEFSAKPKNSNNVKKIDAKVSVNVKEGDIDKNISFNTEVELINTKDEGITYLKVNAEDLNIEFPSIYSIDSKVKSVGFEYTKVSDGDDILGGNVILDASMLEDKYIHKDIVKLKKGINGIITYSYHSVDKPIGEFDLSQLKGLELHLIKEEKIAAIFKGSISNDGLMSGMFNVKEPQTFNSLGFKTTLNSFNVESSYHLKNNEFNFISGEGKILISELKGLEGSLEVDLAYLDKNFSAGLSAGEQSLKFCKTEVSDLDFSFTMDEDLNLKEISGGFAIQPSGMSSKLELKNIQISSGELKQLEVKGNVDYKTFKFDLLSGNYVDNSLNIDAKVLLGDSYVVVDNFSIDKEGEISIGKAKGSIKKSLMEILFEATFNENRFQGAFDATISKKLSVNGTVDMGSSICESCDGGSYNYGYYALTVGAPIPIFPGVSISKLGGQFGYNYEIDFTKDERFGNPKLNSNLVGLSFGLQDNAGLIELAVDPAIYQWGNDEATLALTGTIKAPKNNPIFNGEANINIDMPSYNVYGSLNADINVPPKTGYIVNANTNIQFEMNDKVKSFTSTNMNASILKVINYQGSFSNIREYNSEGLLTGTSGHLDGNLSYGFNYEQEYSGLSYSLDCSFSFNFNAGLSTAFNDNGLSKANIYGNINASGNIDATVLKCSFNPYVSLDGSAELKYLNPLWQMNAQYQFIIGLKSLGEESFEGEYNLTFDE